MWGLSCHMLPGLNALKPWRENIQLLYSCISYASKGSTQLMALPSSAASLGGTLILLYHTGSSFHL